MSLGLFSRRRPPTRAQLVRAAARARRRRNWRKALALYDQLLARQPDDRELQRKVAGLQARCGNADDAWTSFRFAAEAYALEGFPDKAIGVYREAAHYLPRQTDIWIAISEIQLERGHESDAVGALREGRAKLRRRRDRPAALRLLARARQIDPDAFEPGFELAELLRKTGDRTAALRLLAEMEKTATPRQRARLRRRALRYRPTPRNLWRWLRCPRA